MKRILVFVIMMTLLASLNTQVAADTDGGGGAAAYLKMGIGARPLALGEAYTALASGASSTYYNPAALGLAENREFETMHAVLTLDRNLDYFSYAQPISRGKFKGGISFGWIRYGVDEIPETRVYKAGDVIPAGSSVGDPILDAAGNVKVFSYFEDTENAYTLAYGTKLTPKLYGGLSLNYYTHDLFNNDADGYGLDLGFLWKSDERTNIALTIKHLGAELEWDTASSRKDNIQTTTTLGAAYKVRKNITAVVDIEKTGDENIRTHLGVEGWVTNTLALRAGLNKDNISLGIGFKSGDWTFDYAYSDQDLGDVHRISAGRKF
jgi:hypothetical protein